MLRVVLVTIALAMLGVATTRPAAHACDMRRDSLTLPVVCQGDEGKPGCMVVIVIDP